MPEQQCPRIEKECPFRSVPACTLNYAKNGCGIFAFIQTLPDIRQKIETLLAQQGAFLYAQDPDFESVRRCVRITRRETECIESGILTPEEYHWVMEEPVQAFLAARQIH